MHEQKIFKKVQVNQIVLKYSRLLELILRYIPSQEITNCCFFSVICFYSFYAKPVCSCQPQYMSHKEEAFCMKESPSFSLPRSACRASRCSQRRSNSSGLRAGERDKLRGTATLEARTSAEESVHPLVLSEPEEDMGG